MTFIRRTISMTLAGLFLFAGIALADSEWAPNGNDIHNTNSDGNVGIGTTDPSVKLHVIGPDATSGTGWKSEILAGAAKNYQSQRVGLGLDASGPRSGIGLMWNGNTLFKIDNTGNVGIGTTSPGEPLHVVTSATDDGAKIESTNAGTRGASIVLYQNSSSPAPDDVTGRLQFNGKRDDGNEYWMAYIDGLWTDPAVGTGKSRMTFHTRSGETDNIAMTLDHNGKVGIGTTSPGDILTVRGAGNKGITVTDSSDNDRIYLQTDINGQGVLRLYDSGGVEDVRIYAASGENNWINNGGNVGIGTMDPQSKLAVNGIITAKEIKVESGWSDFVFDEDYELASLKEVESFILENKHLPDIPPAKEIVQQGLAVSEILAKQMQKIEEMTLYLIELKKENDQLKERVAMLEGSIKATVK